MATLRTIALPLGNYPTGLQAFGPVSLRPTDTAFYFEIRRSTSADPTIWPNQATQVSFLWELSFDGVNWIEGGGFTAVGGIHVRIGGSEAPITTLLVRVPPGANRQARGTVEVINGPLRTEGFIELRD